MNLTYEDAKQVIRNKISRVNDILKSTKNNKVLENFKTGLEVALEALEDKEKGLI